MTWDLTPKDEVWIEFWLEAGRAKMREFEAAIMATDEPEEVRLAAIQRFREQVGTDHLL